MCSKQPKAQKELMDRRNKLAQQRKWKHYYYEEQGAWTTQEPCVDFRMLPSFSPSLIAYVPCEGNWYHGNSLCNYGARAGDDKAIGDLPKYMFFTPRTTEGLMDIAGLFAKESHSKGKHGGVTKFYPKELKAKVYQFEASMFKRSILRGNVRVVEIWNKQGDVLEYMVFPFGTHQNHETPLYGLCQLNLERDICNAGNGNGNGNGSGSGKNHSRHKPKAKGGGRKGRGAHGRQQDGAKQQKWRCDGIYTAEGLAAFFGQWCPDMNADNYFADKILPKRVQYQTPKNAKKFNPALRIRVSPEVMTGLRQKAFERSVKQRHYGHGSGHGHGGGGGRRGGRGGAFNKVDYLRNIMSELGMREDRFLEEFGGAIDRSIEFAKRHPETVLAQVYIGSKFARLYYEHVLYCEIRNPMTGRCYKFGLPMMRMNKDNTYVIKGILTTKMAMDNVGLNHPRSRWTKRQDPVWWNSTMEDESFSFYEYHTQLAGGRAAQREQVLGLRPNHPAPINAHPMMNVPVVALGGTQCVGGQAVQAGVPTRNRARKGRKKAQKSAATGLSPLVQEHGHGKGRRLLSMNGLNLSQEIGKLNLFIKNLDCEEIVNEIKILSEFQQFGKAALTFCQAYTHSLLSINADSDSGNGVNGKKGIECKSSENTAIGFSEEERLDAFWNVLRLFCQLCKDGIVKQFGKECQLLTLMSEEAMDREQLRCSTMAIHSRHVSLIAWLDVLICKFMVQKRSDKGTLYNMYLGNPSNSVNKGDLKKGSNGGWTGFAEPLKMPTLRNAANGVNAVDTVNGLIGANGFKTLNINNMMNGMNGMNGLSMNVTMNMNIC